MLAWNPTTLSGAMLPISSITGTGTNPPSGATSECGAVETLMALAQLEDEQFIAIKAILILDPIHRRMSSK